LNIEIKDLIEISQKIKTKNILSHLYFWGLVLMIISLPLSRFMISVAQFTLSGILILEFISRDKVTRLINRYPGYVVIILIVPATLQWIGESLARIFIKFFRRDNMPAIVYCRFRLRP
jgi:hypothetical protein